MPKQVPWKKSAHIWPNKIANAGPDERTGMQPISIEVKKKDGGGLAMLTECHRHLFQEEPCAGPLPETGGGDGQKRRVEGPWSERRRLSLEFVPGRKADSGQTTIHANIYSDRHIRQIDTHKDTQTSTNAYMQSDRQTNRQADKMTCRPKKPRRRTNIHTYRQIDRCSDTHTEIHTQRQTH